MPNIGAPELIIVLLVVLLLFGGAKLPKLARSVGEAQKEFKKAQHEGADGSQAAKPVGEGEEKVTMTKAELDALLAEREARSRKDAGPGA